MTNTDTSKEKLAKKLWQEYLRVDTWPVQTEEGAHGAKCAIRCVATSLGVYPEFVDQDDETAEAEPAPRQSVKEAAKVSPIADLLPDAVERAEKAMRKYPQPNYVISKWAEESGEVTKALIHAAEGRETWENIRGELVDTLAMLHRLFIEGDKVHGLPPLRALAQKEQGDE